MVKSDYGYQNCVIFIFTIEDSFLFTEKKLLPVVGQSFYLYYRFLEIFIYCEEYYVVVGIYRMVEVNTIMHENY